jgi:NADH:ubiquinone oxidoreductase subunit K
MVPHLQCIMLPLSLKWSMLRRSITTITRKNIIIITMEVVITAADTTEMRIAAHTCSAVYYAVQFAIMMVGTAACHSPVCVAYVVAWITIEI